MRHLWVFLVACSAPVKPTVARAVEDPVAQPYCPALDDAGVGYWASELFPACQDPPFEFTPTLCNGTRCARPCRQTLARGWSDHESWKLTYADNGTLQTARGTRGMLDTECIWERGKLAACLHGAHSFRVNRDPSGRITAIVGESTTEIRYDLQGRVNAVGARAIAYDAAGRITRVGTTSLEWDARGRVIRERDGDATRTLSYDPRDRLIEVALQNDPPRKPPPPPAPPAPAPAAPPSEAHDVLLDLGVGERTDVEASPSGVRITYDDQSRVTSISVSDGSIMGGSTMTFSYDCQ